MKDFKDNELRIGDMVVFAPAGSYAGINIGEIVKITNKMILIEGKVSGRHLNSNNYRCFPKQVLKLYSK